MPPDLADDLARTARLADGRVLGYANLGRSDGVPLIWFHGTPSSRLEAIWLDRAAEVAGWWLVAFDRPGHGLSSPHPGAALSDIAADVAALADHLELDEFGVVGYSGGAAAALATAAVLGSRVGIVGLVSPWGPPDRPGAYDDVAWSERLSDRVAGRYPIVTQGLFAGLALVLRLAPGAMARVLARRLEGAGWTDDRAGSLAPETLGPIRESLRQGGAGPAQDLHQIVVPWGFDLASVRCPVRVWHGDQDPEIPLHHGRYLAGAVPDGRLEVVAGGDHLALFAHGDEILTDLAAAWG